MRLNQRRSYYRPELKSLNISAKANRILNVVLIAMVLIIFRIWHLAVIQYEDKLDESRKPQRRIIVEPAKRATIRDRFNIPLAINKIQYQAAIVYSQFRQIPYSSWVEAPDGKRIKRFNRKEYISNLAHLLGQELSMDPDRLEDLIYSKASSYSNIPFIIKEEISEKEYYRLKMLEKDWVGIHVQRQPRRYYPFGKVGGDVIGYMGSINRQEYESVIQKMKVLETYLEELESMGEAPLPEGFRSPSEVRRKLKELQEKAYTINDYVGKTGIEGRFEQELRGFHGKKSYYSDSRGNFLRELPGSREPLSGQRFLLTLSIELQEYAEKLLAQNERIREGKVSGINFARQAILALKQPWIKGGAILAMNPHTGEILAMASYPRFDPNDFITSANSTINKQKRSNILRWFENESYLGEIWDRKRPLERERYDDDKEIFYDEGMPLTWTNYLDLILQKSSTVKEALGVINSIENSVELQNITTNLLALSGQTNVYSLFNALYEGEPHIPYETTLSKTAKETLNNSLKKNSTQITVLKRKLDKFLEKVPNSYDKVLVVDLCRMAVCNDRFNLSQNLLKAVGKQSLDFYHEVSASMITVNEIVHEMAKELFQEIDFKPWRKVNEKEFLKQKRAEEKAQNRYAHPYLDYLDAIESEMFKAFWDKNRWTFLYTFLTGKQPEQEETSDLTPYIGHFQTWYRELSLGAHQAISWRDSYLLLQKAIQNLDSTIATQYLRTLRGFEDLNRPLLGRYRHLRKKDNQQLEKHLAAAFYPVHGYGYGRSQAYRQSATQGSIFKLVTAYETLIQRYQQLGENPAIKPEALNPLVMVDQVYRHGKTTYVGYDPEGKPLPQLYKGGRLPKSSAHAIGKLDILRAIEQSSNPYFALLAGDVLESPGDLAKAAKLFSYGCCTGIDLPAEIPGKVPDDLETNRTGLYATAIGQHSLVVTPLQTSIMLSALANGGKVLKPKIVERKAGSKRIYAEEMGNDIPYFPYQDSLALAGINFPLFSAGASHQKNLVQRQPVEVKREVFLPQVVREILLEGMRRVVVKTQHESLTGLSKIYRDYPEAISDYIDMKDHLIGKTSTSESMENLDMDLEYGTNKYTHVWFGGIAFDDQPNSEEAASFLFRDPLGVPELVVVVYLRFGGYGKEAAPVAAQMVKKWKEIKAKQK